jgi:cobalt-zinc-cadmium resistance protein CzcA
VVIGGLVTATLLTLVVLPSLYVSWFSRAGQRQRWRCHALSP